MSTDHETVPVKGTLNESGYSKEALYFAQESARLLRQWFEIEDLTHALNLAGIDPQDVEECIAVWGVIREDGRRVGALVLLKDKRFAYAVGGCAKDGWGNRDVSNAKYYTKRPNTHDLEIDDEASWQNDPPHKVKEWIKGGAKELY